MLTKYYICSMNNIGQYIDSIIKEAGYKQSDVARAIGVSRQLLSYVIAERRELSMQLALKLESFFNLSEGKILKIQTEVAIYRYKQRLKSELLQQLLNARALWSYANVSVENISDDELIENVFIYLDLNEISKIFELFSRDHIRKVWREKLAIQGDYLFNLNVMIALYYFDINEPEKYLKRLEREHIKNQINYA